MGRRKKVEVEEIDVKEPVEIAPESTTPEEAKPAERKKKEIKTRCVVSLRNKDSFLNLRTGAGKENPSVAKIKEGEIVDALGIKETLEDGTEWVMVSYNGEKGYVLGVKIKEI